MGEVRFDKRYILLDNELVEIVEMNHAKFYFAPIDSPNFKGNPTAPTPSGSTTNSLVNIEYLNKVLEGKFSDLNAMTYRGTLAAGSILPKAEAGDTYKVSSDGTISGIEVHMSDMLICKFDNTPSNTPANWDIICISDGRDLVGPASSINESIPIFDGTTGNLVKDSGVKFSQMLRTITAGNGLTGGGSTNNGSVTVSMGNPSDCTDTTTNTTTSTSHTHRVTGFLRLTGGNLTGDVTSTGRISSEQGFFNESDIRLKNISGELNIKLEDILKLPKIYFTYKKDTSNRVNIGVIADEVKKIAPELVITNEEGYLEVAYDKLSVIALHAVDLLYSELTDIKKDIKDIKDSLKI